MVESIQDGNLISKAMINANLWPRINPTTLLKWLIGKQNKNISIDVNILNVCGSIAVLWSLQQRMIRCLSYLKGGESMQLNLRKELIENEPHSNWSPSKYPEWLVLEIEQDMMIRKVQVDIAEKMMNPPDNKNTVMQLNMGEGKTSVIIPLIVTELANRGTLVRVVVLKPLFNMNYNALVHKLGRVLNRRVYVFPCQRDIQFNLEKIELYQRRYEECLRNKGVIITLPEHILSFKLKGLEMCRYESG